jgi:hypothetical protein
MLFLPLAGLIKTGMVVWKLCVEDGEGQDRKTLNPPIYWKRDTFIRNTYFRFCLDENKPSLSKEFEAYLLQHLTSP